MGKYFLIAVIPLFTACSATMETTLRKDTPFAPVNEINGGIISYPNEGRFIDSSRRDAYLQMHEYCKGDYKIIEEGERLGAGAVIPVGNIAVYDQQRKWKIRFECIDHPQALPAAPPSPEPTL